MRVDVAAVTVRDPGVAELVEDLTRELAGQGYAADETFGYSLDRLDTPAVRLVAARKDGVPIGIGGLELAEDGTAELKRFYVRPEHRGVGVADAVISELLGVARERGVSRVRLETGDRQQAAMAFYRRHGFAEIPRFGPYVDSATSICMERML